MESPDSGCCFGDGHGACCRRVTRPIMSAPGKVELRVILRERLAALNPSTRAPDSERLCARVRSLDAWMRARTVLLFSPLPDEPDLWPLVAVALSEGRQVAMPVFIPATGVYGARRILDPARDLVVGRFGVREPGPGCDEVPLATLDLAVVPGLAFTPEGWRLGRGKGFYDRLLKATPALRCGVGRNEQLVAHLPAEQHDTQLDFVLTPSATHWCRRGPE